MSAITRREWLEIAAMLAARLRTDVAAAGIVGPAAPQRVDPRTLGETAQRAADIMRTYSAEGFHRTATPVDRASADHLAARVRAAGGVPRLDPFELSRVDPVAAFLEIGGRRIDGLPMFDGAFTDARGVRGTIGAPGSDKPIALTKVSPNAEVELRRIRELSRHRAVLAVTTGQHPGLSPVNAAYFTEPFGPPVLQIGSEHADVIERAADSDDSVRLVAHATRRPATAFNVVAEVRGTRPERQPIGVMTPRSGWYRNASERGGGIVCWLEALRAVAAAKPLRTVRFVASSGHELGHLGLHAYLKRNPALAHDARVWLHLGANIGAMSADADTDMTASGDDLAAAALRALTPYDLQRLRRSPAAQAGGEAATIRHAGGRFISFIGRNPWFHHPHDTWPARVNVPRVAAFARAVGDLTIALANEP
jgi:hypothetical protein